MEDDRVDAMAVQRALRELEITNRLNVAANGEEALKYLQGCSAADRPCMILLDLNMPRMNGVELLKVLKETDELKMIPVIVLTTSREERDIHESFRLGAAGYMHKSVDYGEFVETVRTIDRYWTLSELPG